MCGCGAVSFPSCTSREQYAINSAYADLYLKKVLAELQRLRESLSVFQSSGERALCLYCNLYFLEVCLKSCSV